MERHPTPRHARRLRVLTAVTSVLLLTPSAHSLNITAIFDSGNSEFPAFDPTGSLLTSILTAATDHWEDIVPISSHNITIKFRWETRAGGTLADMETITTNGSNRVTEGLIRFDTTDIGGAGASWYFDPTPGEDSEYDMQQTFFGDLSATSQTNWFNGSPPDQFEVGYNGFANGSDPGASGAVDVLTVALHELGHAVGLTGAIPNQFAEVADGDYDTDARMLSGTSIGIETFSFSNTAHLAAANTLMFPISTPSRRNRPSTADVLAADSLSDWIVINLRRKEVVNGPNTPTFAHYLDNDIWEGDFFPDAGTDAGIRHGGFVNMLDPSAGLAPGDGFAKNFTVGNSSTFLTLSGSLTAGGDATVDSGGKIFAGNGTTTAVGTFAADSLTLGTTGFGATTGNLTMINGFAIIQKDITIHPGSVIESQGGGSVQAGGVLNNNGLIKSLPHPVRFDTLFLVVAVPGGMIDLDGSNENGRLEIGVAPIVTPPTPADPAQVTITLPFTDAFNSTIDVNEGSTLTVLFNSWTLGTGGTLNLLSSTLNGDPGKQFNVAGTVNVTGTSNINTPINFLAGGAVIVNSTLMLNDTTRYDGGNSFTGTGEIQQNGDAFVNAPTTIDVGRFDLDGAGENAFIVLDDRLTLNVDALDLTDNQFDGELNINEAGRLTVNTPTGWVHAGSLGINGNFSGDAHPTVIDGAPFEFSGVGSIDGQSTIASTLTLTGSMDLTNSFSSLRLAGPGTNTIVGGQLTGIGRLTTAPGVILIGHGEVAPSNFDLDPSSIFLADLGTLEIPGGDFTAGTIGTNSGDGELLILDPWSTSQVAGLELNGGLVTSAAIINDGATAGHGTIAAEGFSSPGTLNPNGVLAIDSAVTFTDTSETFFTVIAPDPLTAAPVAGDDFDQLAVTGAVTLNGYIKVDLKDVLVSSLTGDAADGDPDRPVVGTVYNAMTFAARTGSMFDTIDGTLIATDFALAPLFTDTDLTFRASVPGDTNLDNMVSVADLSTFALHFGTSPGLGSWELGDFNTDGMISVADLSLLALNFGFDLDAGLAATGLSFDAVAILAGIDLSAVPEPSVALIFTLGGMTLLRTRRS